MTARHYFRSSIDELYEIFDLSKDDRKILADLRDELKHRKTKRAKILAKKTDEQLAVLKLSKPAKKPTPATASKLDSGDHAMKPSARENIAPSQPAVSKHGSRSAPPLIDSATTEHGGLSTHRQFQDDNAGAPFVTPEINTKSLPEVVLAAWLSLEVLTPQPLPDAYEVQAIGRKLLRLEDHPEPWTEPKYRKKGKEKAVYWMVYLGELNLAKSVEAILQLYPDDAIDERSTVQGNTSLAVIVVDNQGCPLNNHTFLSSFAWGYGQIRAGRLKGLAGFADAERITKAELEDRLIRRDEDDNILPLAYQDILHAKEWLAKKLNIPWEEVSQPGIAIRSPQWGSYHKPPEPELFNSFFIDDLVKARSAFDTGQAGHALSAYMQALPVRERRDVVRDTDIIAETIAPARIPLIRWPGPGRYPLVLMQQIAINHAAEELAGGGMVAVNGPPGTGKTTLLRDIVAKTALDRAIAMSKFDIPAQAFKHLTSMKTGQAFTHLYLLDESLIGHEIVIASSNNKAVENISREIPYSTAISDDLNSSARYFQSISDSVAAGDGPITDGVTWGLAAAVLGNSANCYQFIQSFYWHKERGMARYLGAILGGDQPQAEDYTESTDQQKIIDVVTLENPPTSEIEAQERWRIARQRFHAKLKNAERLQKRAQAGYEAIRRKPEATKQADIAACVLSTAEQALATAVEKEKTAKRLLGKAKAGEQKAVEDRTAVYRMRPGFFSRLFYTQPYRQWRVRMMSAQDALAKVREQLQSAEEDEEDASRKVVEAKRNVETAESEKKDAVAALNKIIRQIEIFHTKIRENFPDEKFWSQENDILQLRSPWVFEEWQRARDDLFVETFALHRAFIDAAAKPLRHNLRAAMELIKRRSLTEKQEPVRCSLWASLFLVVPAVSTTFASTARLFGPLYKEQIGWLLINEAGQAAPQAAVGAILRAKRVVVIGDPLQIQPVVTTPPKLIRSIFSGFGVKAEEWGAPEMSVQTLADRVSWFGTNINTDDGNIWLGSPLRVHRRCENPMFRISNHVAYNGMMVYGTKQSESEIGKALGESRWMDVAGDAVSKWSEKEGMTALELLRKLLDAGIEDPDIFFITPFRIVAHKLREMIRTDRSIADCLPGNPWQWTQERVGTIHTFQGKEADAVVLVLGAPLEASFGARCWASRTPNLLNVAVTRAKHRLYVIGNRAAWRNAGSFGHLFQVLAKG